MTYSLIGLTGKKGAGKDTVGKYLVENYGYTRVALADKLKESAAALFDVPQFWLDDLKSQTNAYVAIGYENDPAPSFQQIEGQPSKMWSPVSKLTVREFLQRYGTEAHRHIFGDDFWIWALEESTEWLNNNKLVVTDVRFKNEADSIGRRRGLVVKIDRPLVAVKDDHVSEAGIPAFMIDYVIHNVGDINDLHRAVDAFMEIVPRGILGPK